MVELFEQDIRTNDRQSSKGNQLKWLNSGKWYKADYAGYEGLAEYIVSMLLDFSTLAGNEFVHYETEQIHNGYQNYLGCSSLNFLPSGWQMITLERLFQSYYNESLNRCLYTIRDHEERLRFLVEQTERVTGLADFGAYMSKLLTIDTFFLNEDRHTHNIAVLLDGAGEYHLCPIFDNGGSLLSDTTMDYPLHAPLEELMQSVRPKTFCTDFEEQMDIAEQLYGRHVKFCFRRKDIVAMLDREGFYSEEVKKRVLEILQEQIRRYPYLF